jgi:hypothetical protein
LRNVLAIIGAASAREPTKERNGWRVDHSRIGWLASRLPSSLANNRDLRIATARVDEFAAILAGTRSQAFRRSAMT